MPEIPVLQWFKDVALKEEINEVHFLSQPLRKSINFDKFYIFTLTYFFIFVLRCIFQYNS